MKERIFFIPRIPLDEEGLCAHATIESAARAFKIKHIHQDDLHIHVGDPSWGTEPAELTEMSKELLPDDHIFAKEKWTFDEISSLLGQARVVIVLDVTDCLDRVSKITGEHVNEVDGHYVILSKLVKMENTTHALIIDPSKEEIVVEGSYGIINTNQENVYLIPFEVLDRLWIDDKKDGSLNDHWALVMLHPDDDPGVLDRFRK
jgi:hypothetical protein